MNIVVHDYSGHPFQVQLSRRLAALGHRVHHLYSADFQTPKGDLIKKPGDPASFEIVGLSAGVPFAKDSFVRRRFQEQRFGRLVAAEIDRLAPDVVISSNAPLDAQLRIAAACRRRGCAFIFWLQDIYSIAIDRVLRDKAGLAGVLIGAWYRRVERQLLRRSDAVVAISADFVADVRAAGVASERVHVIENWAPLDGLDYRPPGERPDGGRPTRFVYTGTLGYKHNPGLLAQLAAQPGVEVHVYSEGRSADELKAQAARDGLGNLVVRPWVPFAELPGVLAGADVLVAMIEAEAGAYSVPSKVLTYLAAGRPILAAIPTGNLAARLLEREQAGLVRAPADVDGLLAEARRLAADPGLRHSLGLRGRRYAEQAFDIQLLGAKFENVVRGALGAGSQAGTEAA